MWTAPQATPTVLQLSEIIQRRLHILQMGATLSVRLTDTRLHNEGRSMSTATALAATALQLSEAATRQGSPEHASMKALLALLAKTDG